MGAQHPTFKFKAQKTYTFTEQELARLLSNHICVYISVNSGRSLPQKTVDTLIEKTIEEMRERELIQNLNKDYSTIVEEAEQRAKDLEAKVKKFSVDE